MPYVANVIEGMQFRGQSTMNTEELFVHDGSEGQCAEGLHACIIDALGVLALAYLRDHRLSIQRSHRGRKTHTFELEGEVVCQVPALVVTAQEEEGIRVPDFQGPKI